MHCIGMMRLSSLKNEVVERQKKTRKMMSDKGVDALVLGLPEDIQYLTGVTEPSVQACGIVIVSQQTQPVLAVMWLDKECVKQKVKSMIIISAGFGEFGEEGKKVQKEVVDILEKANIPMVGPNCLGIIRPVNSMNASFAPTMPPDGNIAFISQSGALADSIIDWSVDNRYGFSAIVSYGNKAMLDVYDFLEYFDKDEKLWENGIGITFISK